MKTTIDPHAPTDIARAAKVLAERYSAAPPRETEAAIAVLALWALDAVETGRMDRHQANAVFTMLRSALVTSAVARTCPRTSISWCSKASISMILARSGGLTPVTFASSP